MKEIETGCKTFKPAEMGRKRINQMCSLQQLLEMEGEGGNKDFIRFPQVVCHFFHWALGCAPLEEAAYEASEWKLTPVWVFFRKKMHRLCSMSMMTSHRCSCTLPLPLCSCRQEHHPMWDGVALGPVPCDDSIKRKPWALHPCSWKPFFVTSNRLSIFF